MPGDGNSSRFVQLLVANTSARIDRDERKKGELGKPSDHAPVLAEFDLSGERVSRPA